MRNLDRIETLKRTITELHNRVDLSNNNEEIRVLARRIGVLSRELRYERNRQKRDALKRLLDRSKENPSRSVNSVKSISSETSCDEKGKLVSINNAS